VTSSVAPPRCAPRTALWVAAISATVLAVSWVLALSDEVSGAEEWVFRLFNDLPDWLEGPTWPVMQLGAFAAVPVVAVLAFVVWHRWEPALAIACAGTAAWLGAKLVKEAVGRGRPQGLLDDVNLRPEWDGLGYVSGHAAVAFAIATVLAPRLGRVGKALVWSGAIATALLRMYTAAHLPLDVVGGAAVGMTLGCAANLWSSRVGQGDEASA